MDNIELRKYVPIAKMLGDTFGKNCEVVLHDLTKPKKSVVFTYNNGVTGREVGQSFDHLIRDVLLSPDLYDDYRCNYLFTTEDGRRIKSSTTLLRNDYGRVIGALCINVDMTVFEQFENVLFDFISPKPRHGQNEIYPTSNIIDLNQVFDDLISSILADVNISKLSRKQRVDLISFMDNKGVFLVKGAVEKVAEKMNISAVTVYSYLDEIRKRT